jgi:lactate permease
VEKGWFQILQQSIGGITADRRLQLLLISFCFGAFFEGAAGFGTPVAVTAAILIGLGFSPLAASGLSLIANTAPVAFGALGAPIAGLATSTGLDPFSLGAMIGRQLPFFSLIVPFWLIWAFAGFRGMLGVWPAILVCGVSFAIPQFLISNYVNPWIVDIGASVISIGCLIGFLRIWQPKQVWLSPTLRSRDDSASDARAPVAPVTKATPAEIRMAWAPWLILTLVVGLWGSTQFKAVADPIATVAYSVPGLDKMVQKVPPVVLKPAAEAAVFKFTYLSYTGTGILIAAIIAAIVMRFSPLRIVTAYFETLWVVRYSLLTIVSMLAIGTLTRYSGVDATLGLAFATTGVLYPFFGTLLGWLGVALTGSDTASNVLFGGMQKVAAEPYQLVAVAASWAR